MPEKNQKTIKKVSTKGVSKQKTSVQTIVAIIGLVGVVLAACIGLLGMFVSSLITYWGNLAQVQIPINASQTAEARITDTPFVSVSPTIPSVSTLAITTTSGVVLQTMTPSPGPSQLVPYGWINDYPLIGEQLDFSVLGGDPEKIPDFFSLKSSPISGIYLDDFYLDGSGFVSYKVGYQNEELVNAQTDVCLINTAYAEWLQTPLNLKVDLIAPQVAIFVDGNYGLLITGMELLLTNYTEPRMDFEKVWVAIPGAGGMGLPFQSVRTKKITVNKNQEKYEINFTSFYLSPKQGVNIYIPVLMEEPGKYQFQTKIYGVANPAYEGDYSGDVTLTSGRFSYEWLKLDDPRNYKLDDISNINNSGASAQPTLVPCP